ncbi:hypothetical protein AB0B28_02885 [Glycomyces sp. NPDC046736]|uniref:hypothetical protein n=1 Tax=Glycomyces sp. NPDC046736 TaxID=3155615 RepID=UPI0033DA0BE9
MSDDPYWNPGQAGEPSGRFSGGDPLVTGDFESWWHATLDVVQRSWRTVGLILLIGVVLPRWILGAFNSNVRDTEVKVDVTDFGAVVREYAPSAIVGFIGVILSLAVLYVAGSAALAAVRVATAEAAGGFLSLGEAFRFGFRRGGKFFLWLLLAWVTIGVGLVLCVLPGLWAIFALSLMAPAAVFEARRSPYARSIQLTHSAFWPALGRLIIVVLVAIAANIIINMVGLLLAGVWHGLFAPWLAAVLTIITEAIMALLLLAPMIWILAASLCTYAWLRGRTESVSATSLSAEAAGATAPAAPQGGYFGGPAAGAAGYEGQQGYSGQPPQAPPYADPSHQQAPGAGGWPQEPGQPPQAGGQAGQQPWEAPQAPFADPGQAPGGGQPPYSEPTQPQTDPNQYADPGQPLPEPGVWPQEPTQPDLEQPGHSTDPVDPADPGEPGHPGRPDQPGPTS